MLKKIYLLLPEQERRKCISVAISVFVRGLLDFAGLAALLPVMISVLGDNSDKIRALILCGVAFLFIVIKNGLNVILARYQMKFMLRLYHHFSYRMFCNYYRRGLLFLKGRSSVQLSYDVTFQCYSFSLNVLQPIMSIAAESMLITMIVVCLLCWEPFAGAMLCLGFVPIVIIYARFIKGRLREYGKRELEARRQQSRTVTEAFRGYPELEINSAFSSVCDNFSNGLNTINDCRLRMDMAQKLPSFVSEAAIVIGLAIILVVTSNNLTLVSGIFAVAAFRLIPAVRGVMNSWSVIQANSFCIDVVADGIKDECEPISKDDQPLAFNEEICVEDVSFSFPDADGVNVIEHFDLHIKKGEHIGFRGASGSGKSTLFNLMLGFYPATRGRITVDGVTLERSNLRSWHKMVGYVPQEIFIIKGSLAENIALGFCYIDEKKIWQVLEHVQLREWVESLPHGIHSDLGEYGSRMSGGQKQRIGIARALYKQAEVLLFDEATSALDNKTEREINDAIEHLSITRKELTILVIAHRESSLSFCDRIISLGS